MQKTIAVLSAALLYTLSLPIHAETLEDPYQLEQVVIFSRHGLRAPLENPEQAFSPLTTYQWPSLTTQPGHLTARGGALESYFAHYLRDWFAKQQLLPIDRCPSEQDVYIYTNSLQRTIATGQYFAIGAFAGCQIPVIHKTALGSMDPMFAPTIHNGSADFQQAAVLSIEKTVGSEGLKSVNQQIMPTYNAISRLIDYPHSPLCIRKKECDFSALPGEFRMDKVGEEPTVTGSLKLANGIADTLLLYYYEGMPLPQVGWGKITTIAQLQQIVDAKKAYDKLLFSAPIVARDIAKNVLTTIAQQFDPQREQRPKLTYLVGHDSNIVSLLSALNVTPYHLAQQLENTPIGGKIVFQKWRDTRNEKRLLKIQYVYQSFEQLHQFSVLNELNPPQWHTLTLQECPADTEGFCDFDRFMQLLISLTKSDT